MSRPSLDGMILGMVCLLVLAIGFALGEVAGMVFSLVVMINGVIAYFLLSSRG